MTATDLGELQRILVESGAGGADDARRAAEQAHGLGLFVRSLAGVDRTAAKEALRGLLAGEPLSAGQIEFVDLILNHLSEHGVTRLALLYESPFSNVTPHGPDGLFGSNQVDELVRCSAPSGRERGRRGAEETCPTLPGTCSIRGLPY